MILTKPLPQRFRMLTETQWRREENFYDYNIRSTFLNNLTKQIVRSQGRAGFKDRDYSSSLQCKIPQQLYLKAKMEQNRTINHITNFTLNNNLRCFYVNSFLRGGRLENTIKRKSPSLKHTKQHAKFKERRPSFFFFITSFNLNRCFSSPHERRYLWLKSTQYSALLPELLLQIAAESERQP